MKVFYHRFIFIFPVLAFTMVCDAQTIGNFNSIQPTAQTQNFVLPATHSFQRIIRSGDALSLGGNLGTNLDFTAYVPIGESSTNGYLSISSETTPGEVAILSITYNSGTQLWSTSSGGKVPFPSPDLGSTSRFCSGTVTPDNTVIIAEEATTAGDANGDGYQDIGWLIEIDPATRTVINQDGVGGVDKLWAVGRQSHENCAILPDESVIYWGADDNPTGYMYKFVPTTPGNYINGTLFALVTTGALGTGSWVAIPNSTQMQRNNTVTASTSAGAFNFNGIEDVEIGPDGRIYFAAKAAGVIYRFTDNGATVSNLEVFVNSVNYDVDDAGPFSPEPWGVGNDNLAFDGEGNLWVLQDGSRNHIWVVGPSHTGASPAIKLFATTPAGSEPTGITFSPDYKFMFISFQHPNAGNSSSQADAAGTGVVFNTHSTVVVARKEFLGTAALPVRFLNFTATPQRNSISVDWKITNAVNHSYFAVERSTDNIHFSEIHRNTTVISTSSVYTFNFTDNTVNRGSKYYYRVKQCDIDGRCHFTPTKAAKTGEENSSLWLSPVPATNNLYVHYYSSINESTLILIRDLFGRIVSQQINQTSRGNNEIALNIQHFPAGSYLVSFFRDSQFLHKHFVKL